MNGDFTALVAEADMTERRHIVQMLFRMGYKVLYAESGATALVIAERYRDAIHLLLADVSMPDMSGSQLASRLQPTRPEMRVLYISENTADEPNEHSVRETAGFIRRPFSRGQLAQQIGEVLD